MNKKINSIFSSAACATFCFFSVAGAFAADFPKVTPEMQRDRDATRRSILEDELKSETEKLDNLQAEVLAASAAKKSPAAVQLLTDSVARSQKNIEALKREIAMTGNIQKTSLNPAQSKVVTQNNNKNTVNQVEQKPFWDTYARNQQP